jgi:hypothetical protein
MCVKSFVLGGVASFLLACSLGAVMVDDAEARYLKACQALQGEAEWNRLNFQKPVDRTAANRRVSYWLAQMEKFKP